MNKKPSRGEFKRINASISQLIRMYGIIYMIYMLLPEKFITKVERFIFAWLYRLGFYKATIISDGIHDNRRAMQARLDINGGLLGIRHRERDRLTERQG